MEKGHPFQQTVLEQPDICSSPQPPAKKKNLDSDHDLYIKYNSKYTRCWQGWEEKETHSLGGNANRCGHSGKKYGVSSES